MSAAVAPASMKGRRSQAGITLMELLVAMIVLSVISSMLIMGWFNLQRASARAVTSVHTQGSVRDAMARVASEVRDAQPTAFPTTTPAPTVPPILLPVADKISATFYSAYNEPDVLPDGSGTGGVHRTRIWLDTPRTTWSNPAVPHDPNDLLGVSAGKTTLYWQRDKDDDGFDIGDPIRVLGENIVNCVSHDAVWGTAYTAVFHYFFDGNVLVHDPMDTVTSAGLLPYIDGVQINVIVDNDIHRPPGAADLTLTVRIRNYDSYQSESGS